MQITEEGETVPLPKIHPLSKTSIDARRAIQRLEIFAEQFPNDPYVQNGNVASIIEAFREIRSNIPGPLRDVDTQ